jgi:hypothetical protein
MNCDFIKKILSLDYSYASNYRMLCEATKMLGNLLTFEFITEDFIRLGCLDFIGRHCTSLNPDIRYSCVWMMSNILCSNDIQIIITVIKSGILNNVLSLIHDPTYTIAREVCWLIGILVSVSSYDMMLYLVDSQFWDYIFHILVNSNQSELLKFILESIHHILTRGKEKSPNVFVEQFVLKGGMDYLEQKTDHSNDDVRIMVDNLLNEFSNNNNS